MPGKRTSFFVASKPLAKLAPHHGENRNATVQKFLLASIVCLSSIAARAQAPAPATLKDAFRGGFVIGAAINTDQITGKDARGDAIITQQFNSISPENVMKWEVIHPAVRRLRLHTCG